MKRDQIEMFTTLDGLVAGDHPYRHLEGIIDIRPKSAKSLQNQLPRQRKIKDTPPKSISAKSKHFRDGATMARRFPGAVHLGAVPRNDGQDAERLDALAEMAARTGASLVATNAPLMHRARRRRVADVLTCLREGLTIDRIGANALVNAEQRLKSGAEMAGLFRDYPEAIARTVEITRRCTFSLDELRYEYPNEIVGGEAPQIRLKRLAQEGLAWRYPDGVPERIAATMERELILVGELGFAPYFLTVHEIVTFACGRGILCQGRGSAANSVICYALGITEADPP